MIEPGDTLLDFDFGNHLWIVLSRETDDRRIALASLTSHGRRPICHRRSCVIVLAGEHIYLRNDSCVHYGRAVLNPLAPLLEAQQRGQLPQHQSCSPKVLLRIQQGALDTLETPDPVRAAIRATLEAGA